MYTITIERWKRSSDFHGYAGTMPEEKKITCETLCECMAVVNFERLNNDLTIYHPIQISNVEEA